MLFKINGINSIKQLQQLDGLDVDFAGIFFNADGTPVAPLSADDLQDMDVDVKLAGIFSNVDPEVIIDAVETYNLSVVQLHGDESPFICERISEAVEVIKTFRIDTEGNKTIDYMIQEYDDACDYYLFEPVHPSQGNVCLEKIRNSRIEKPFFLSDALLQDGLVALDTFQHPDFFCIDFSNQEKKNPGIENLPAILLLKNRFKIQNN
ncbi:MAG TPA: hypothetical protein PLE75_01470 [Ferruginibacter sp.]|nr:hypothetical protein [Ferruginibacter sp.]